VSLPWDNEAENKHFDALISRDDLSWDQIRSSMVHAGYSDRGPRAYQSRAYRMAQSDPEVVRDERGQAHYDVYKFLRDAPRSLAQICDKFDRPPYWVRALIEEMKADGYNIVESETGAAIPTTAFPVVDKPKISIADMIGHDIKHIGLISDLHSGGEKSQPTAFNRFIRYANEEWDVDVFLYHGDVFAGVFGYRGQDIDQAPWARAINRELAHHAVRRQIQAADTYFPKINGVRYFVMGGNHDWWHVVHTGIDSVRSLCDMRNDMTYMGYDMAKLPLTDKCYYRMWHPTGGVAYAKSYRVQKAIESEGLESLKEAIRKEESPLVSIIGAGHLHQGVWVPSSPVYGALVPCFEGQTNYLKKKKLSPDIGGVILRLIFKDDGRIRHIGYDYVPSVEIKKDYENWPQPEITELDFEQENLEAIFSVDELEHPPLP